MPVDAHIKDGEGSKYAAGVTQRHALKVTLVEPEALKVPTVELTGRKVLYDLLKNSGGSSDLRVVGSLANPVKFSVTAENDKVKWITGLRILLNGTYFEITTNDFRRFGLAATAPGLTNGLVMYVKQGSVTTNLYVSAIKYVGQFFDLADDFVNLANAVSAQSDFLSFDYHFDVPVVLPEGSVDCVTVEVRDDLTSLDLFQVVARGYQEVGS